MSTQSLRTISKDASSNFRIGENGTTIHYTGGVVQGCYSVRFDSNDVIGDEYYAFVSMNSTYSLPTSTSFTPQLGKDFDGWATTPNGAKITSATISVDSNRTLYARWKNAVLAGTVGITGTAKIGQTLTADTSAITNNTGTLSYQWKSGGTNVGTNSSTYTIQTSDVGKVITVVVSSSKQTGSLISVVTAPVAKVDQSIYAPSASSRTETGVTLAVSTGHGATRTESIAKLPVPVEPYNPAPVVPSPVVPTPVEPTPVVTEPEEPVEEIIVPEVETPQGAVEEET